jgi:hypothetical protein
MHFPILFRSPSSEKYTIKELLIFSNIMHYMIFVLLLLLLLKKLNCII